MSADHVIKVWDLRNNGCVQTIEPDHWPIKGEERHPYAMFFDTMRKRVVTAVSCGQDALLDVTLNFT